MQIINKVFDLQNLIKSIKLKNKTIGFVPTMGALHKGHLSLIKQSREENDVTVSSIFVNPIQFNNPSDFINYPITIEKDIKLLNEISCDILFAPSEKEMYPKPIDTKYNFGKLEQILEGLHRPGHFNGVAIVVKRLFDIVTPDKAYFGEKDFQQLLIIKELVKLENLSIQIIPCKIFREDDGLAMSSRNLRLTETERKVAPLIYDTLQKVIKLKDEMSIQQIKAFVDKEFKKESLFKLEHFEIVDHNSLETINNWTDSNKPHAFIAAYLGNVRLIDNQKLF